MYYLYINEQQTGPYDMDQLRQLVLEGTLTKETFVWNEETMMDWAKASDVDDVNRLFTPKVPEMPSGISASHSTVYGGAGGIHTTSNQSNDYSQHIDKSQHIDTSSHQTIYDNGQKNYYQTTQEAQKTDTQIAQENENMFIQAVRERLADGILTRQEEAELEQVARDCKVNPLRAKQIIEAERKSAEALYGGQDDGYYTNKILHGVCAAVNTNQIDILKHSFKALEDLAKNSDDANVLYYYYMLFASLNPAGCTVDFVNHHTDNYWQLFWTCIAYIKLGQTQNANAQLPRLAGYGGPHGDMDLLSAVVNLSDVKRTHNNFYKQQLEQNLQSAASEGMSEQLNALWYAVQELTKEKPEPEEWCAFYVQTTLMELGPEKEKQMQKGMPQMQTPPPMPKFDPQKVELESMQGWNPLKAADQMGLGNMPTMQETQARLDALRSQIMGGMPQMPQMGGMIQMSSMMTPPTMPGMNQAPQMPQSVPSMSQVEDKSSNGGHELVMPEPSPSAPQERVPQYGIIFTDSLALAEKYHCEPQDVYNILNKFIEDSAQAEQHWYLLDAGNYREQLGNDPYWGDYNEILSNYIYENGFHVGIATPVFIIGGSDVIPIPEVEDTYNGGKIPTDFAYCFSTTFFSDLWDGDHTISDDYVRNNISRLPLEKGEMHTTIQDDLEAYFNLCSIYADEIEVKGVTMASNVEWKLNSITMSHHLPLVHVNTNDEGEIYNGIYSCPKLIASNDENIGAVVDEKVLSDYKEAIRNSGMLLFNLHGGPKPGRSGFYCDYKEGQPEAFNIELMKQSNARVLNTVACFGARYDGYERDDSMLLSSLYGGGFLLYAGSSISVPMLPDRAQHYPEGVTQYPGSGSEKFMPLYCYYQFCGLPAGQAMMQAKLDYFNTFRHIEWVKDGFDIHDDSFCLSTIEMFGLYGNPMLHVNERLDVEQAAQRYEVLPQLPKLKTANMPVKVRKTKCLLNKEQLHESKSMLDQLRYCVDQNLTAIHDIVKKNLYDQLALDPRWLTEVDGYNIGSKSGYLYKYELDNKLGTRFMVEVDERGQITCTTTYK